MRKIVVIGSLNMDIVALAPRLPAAGETLMGTAFFTTPGGKGANQAYAAAKLGGEVAMLGRVGADDYGRQMRSNLKAVGCDVSATRSVEGASGVGVICVAQSGENSIVVVPGANLHYAATDLAADQSQLSSAGYVLLQLEIPLPTVVAAAQAARHAAATVILDPAPARASLPAELLQAVDILTPNEVEASQLAGGSAGTLDREAALSIATQLRARGPTSVIIKMGAQGCLLAQAEQTTWIAAPSVEVADTTAAGDVFNGALAVACAEGAALADA